jgi:DUF4097 and DUF4098 domain-containing protein YvlB
MTNGARQRSSIFTGLLLILLGFLFLLQRFEPHLGIGHLVRRYWPLLLIVWGIAKLIDHFTTSRTGEGRPPILSGPEAALLILIVAVLIGMSFSDWFPNVISTRFHGDSDDDISIFGQRYSESQEISKKAIPAGAHVTIRTGRGNITVHASEGNDLRVAASESATGSTEAAARDRMKDVKVVIDESRGSFEIHPVHQDEADGHVSIDLDVSLPKQSSVSANSEHGDISISGMAGAVSAAPEHGDVDIHDVADVSVQMQKGGVRITDVSGNLKLTGKGDDIDISDVAGDAAVEGDFFGTVRLRNVTKTTRYISQRSDLTIAKMTGLLELDSGDLRLSDVAGFAKLITHDKDLEIENVAGKLNIEDTHGDIQVGYSQPPREDASIANGTGDVDLTLPSRATFEISAVSHKGEAQSEFESGSLEPVNDSGTGRLNGKIGSQGPKITITTNYGTITLHKSS